MVPEGSQLDRDRFLEGKGISMSVPATILSSWKRAESLKLQPDCLTLPFIREPNPDSPLAQAAGTVLEQMADGLSGEPVSVILAAADGVVLRREAFTRALQNQLDRVRLSPGFSYSEAYVGTNGIGTTLETRQPTVVQGYEHYASSLCDLVCAGAPIIHPISGALLGALDLTGWANSSGSLLCTLARSAATQVEGVLLSQASAAETTLVRAYLRACRKFPQRGVLAVGGDLVLANRLLRSSLDGQDQAALLEHAADQSLTSIGRHFVVQLPSGRTVKLVASGDLPLNARTPLGIFCVHILDPLSVSIRTRERPSRFTGIRGSSASWKRVCMEVSQHAEAQQWVVVEGEAGSGRTAVLRAAAAAHIAAPTRTFSMSELPDVSGTEFRALEHELMQDRFSVIVRDVDYLPEPDLCYLANLLLSSQHSGWVGITVSESAESSSLGTHILPQFSRTVTVPALRHRIEDISELVPFFVRQHGSSDGLEVSSAAMAQLSRYHWPGNVAQLRVVLADVMRRQRSGTIDVEQLPPVVRAVSRRVLTPIEALERDAIVRSLTENHGNRRAAAAALGISRATIYRKIKEFGID